MHTAVCSSSCWVIFAGRVIVTFEICHLFFLTCISLQSLLSYRYQLNEQHEECVRDWKKVMELDSTSENKKALKDAEKQLKMSQRKDYYKILGIEKDANDDQIKKAYRKKALLHHPGQYCNVFCFILMLMPKVIGFHVIFLF